MTPEMRAVVRLLINLPWVKTLPLVETFIARRSNGKFTTLLDLNESTSEADNAERVAILKLILTALQSDDLALLENEN